MSYHVNSHYFFQMNNQVNRVKPANLISALQRIQIAVLTSGVLDDFHRWLFSILQSYFHHWHKISSINQITGSEDAILVIGRVIPDLQNFQLALFPPGMRRRNEDWSRREKSTIKIVAFPSARETWEDCLNDGLNWLASVLGFVSVPPELQTVRIKPENTATVPVHFYITSATLNEIVNSHVKESFLDPLMELIGQWNSLGLTHPVSFRFIYLRVQLSAIFVLFCAK